MQAKTFYKSKSRQNIMNIKNETFRLKYSNPILFERRELQLHNKQSKKIFNTKTFYNSKKQNQKLKSNKYSLISPKLLKTDSIPYLLNSLSTFHITYTQTKNKSLKNSTSLNYTPRRKTPNLYLTETELLNNNTIIDTKEKNSLNINLKGKKNDKYSDFFKTDFYPQTPDYKNKNRNEKDKDGILFLLNIQKEANKYKNKKREINIDLKIEELNKKDYGTKKMIKKTKSYKFFQYMAAFRKDRKNSLNEEYQTKIDYIQEKINSLQEALKLFNIKFINKLSNYVKYLDNISDIERRKNFTLLKKKIEYKREIEQINSEIEKMQIKKNQIVKWVFLQIQVKERKLVLPHYYKKIIIYNKDQILLLQKKFYENNKKEIKGEGNKSESGKKKKNVMKKSISLITNEKNYYPLLRKATNEAVRVMNNFTNSKMINIKKEKNNSIDKNNIGVINNTKGYITKDEFDKILFWKFSPIFKTSEEFMESLREMDNQNIYLLKYYNQIQSKIYDELNNLRKIINNQDKNNIIEYQINEKLKVLEKLKTKYKSIYKIYVKIKEENNIKKRPTFNNDSSPISHNTNNNINNNITDKIYSSIINLLNNCKKVNNMKLIELLDYNIKKSNNKEGEIIFILEYIECTIDYLTERIKLYKRDENKNELLQKIIIEIDKKHKKEKPDKQRLEDLEKSLKLLKKIESKNNKMLIHLRRINLFPYNMKNEKEMNKINENKNKDDFPTLDEFIKNPNIINDIYYNDEKEIKKRLNKRKSVKKKTENK